jgi:aminoglycoside phosphotransferase (APT) family kinase protein
MSDNDVSVNLAAWLRTQLPDADDVVVDGLGQLDMGHSAEMLLLTVGWRTHEISHEQDVVVRICPPSPGLLEPYDVRRQFDILSALEETPVRAPRALWIEESGDVLGRPFYVMERLAGRAYEREIPPHLKDTPDAIARMSEHIFDQLAAMHQVDIGVPSLRALGSGVGYVDRELDHWEGQLERWKRGTLPAMERLISELRRTKPEQNSDITLVHGDPKPGNFAFVGEEVTAVFDWEMATVGDPLADLGWAEMTWRITPFVAGLPPAHFDELLARYEQQTGITVHHREWYAAFQAFKMATIQLVAAMLFDQGFSDDLRFAGMAYAVPMVTNLGLQALGIGEELEPGPVRPRKERLDTVRQQG